MRRGTFEIEAVTGFELEVPLILQPDFEVAAKDMEELLAFMGVRFAAATAGFDAEEMRFHGGVAPSEQLHADVGAGFENLAIGGVDQGRSIAVGFEKRKKVGFVETRDAAERGDGRAHLAAFERAEKTDGDAGSAGDLREGKTALQAQAAKALAGRLACIGRSHREALFFQDVNNRGRIQSTRAAKEDRALQEANVRFGEEPVAAFGALRGDEAERLPGSQRR